MAWVETTTSWQAERTTDGYYHVVRMFRVTGIPRQTILASPGQVADNPTAPTAFLPVVLDRDQSTSEISVLDGLILKAYHQILHPLDHPTQTDVEYRYSNDPRLIATKIEDTMSFQTEYMTLPTFRKSLRVPLGGAARNGWQEVRHSFPFTVGRIQRSVLIRDSQYFTARTVVRAQTNKIHLLPWAHGPIDEVTPWYRFEGGDFTRYSPSFYMARYSWWLDGGHTSVMLTAAGQDQAAAISETIIPSQTIQWRNSLWTRPPYHTLDVLKVEGGQSGNIVPFFVGWITNEVEEDGWTSLVGL